MRIFWLFLITVVLAAAAFPARAGDAAYTLGPDDVLSLVVYGDFAIGGDRTGHYTHLAVLRVTGDGDVYISEKE